MSSEKSPTWEERVAEALKEGVPVFQRNGLPIVCQRGFDGALLEHEHADHPTYRYPVTVEYTLPMPDFFAMHKVSAEPPPHYDHRIKWDHGDPGKPVAATCLTCNEELDGHAQDNIRNYHLAELERSQMGPHQEALIYADESIALTLYECCYTLWRFSDGKAHGVFLHGPTWSRGWKLSDAAVEKIWAERIRRCQAAVTTVGA